MSFIACFAKIQPTLTTSPRLLVSPHALPESLVTAEGLAPSLSVGSCPEVP